MIGRSAAFLGLIAAGLPGLLPGHSGAAAQETAIPGSFREAALLDLLKGERRAVWEGFPALATAERPEDVADARTTTSAAPPARPDLVVFADASEGPLAIPPNPRAGRLPTWGEADWLGLAKIVAAEAGEPGRWLRTRAVASGKPGWVTVAETGATAEIELRPLGDATAETLSPEAAALLGLGKGETLVALYAVRQAADASALPSAQTPSAPARGPE